MVAQNVDLEQRIKALNALDNAIFFSQKTHPKLPPLPNRLSDGDLDGDRFEVLTKQCGLWGEAYETSNFVPYTCKET